MYLRGGFPQTSLPATTLRLKLQIKLAKGTLTLGQPILALTLYCLALCRTTNYQSDTLPLQYKSRSVKTGEINQAKLEMSSNSPLTSSWTLNCLIFTTSMLLINGTGNGSQTRNGNKLLALATPQAYSSLNFIFHRDHTLEYWGDAWCNG